MSQRFRHFYLAFGLGLVMICGGLIVTALRLDPKSPGFDDPTPVSVTMTASGVRDLQQATGCTDPDNAEFLAVGGTWARPLLQVDGTDCRFGASWQPDEDRIELHPS
jgi:hypothetical protein